MFQKVKLLNLYIEHTATEEKSVPYLVSMDVSLFPSTPKAEVNGIVVLFFQWTDPNGVPGLPITVVPVIASEDVEVSDHTRNVQNALSLAAALSGTSPNGFGGSGRFNNTLDTLRKMAGQDINSLQLVSNASRDSLVVRFGANFGVDTKYALFPQTYRVHCLVMIPKDYVQPEVKDLGRLSVLASTHFRYTESIHPTLDKYFWFLGRSGVDIPRRELSDRVNENLKSFNSDTDLEVNVDEFTTLWTFYDRDDFRSFRIAITRKLQSPSTDDPNVAAHASRAWAEMGQIFQHASWSSSSIEIPKLRKATADKYIAFDDGQSTSLNLPAAGFSEEPGCWNLEVDDPRYPYKLLQQPDEIKITDDDSQLQFKFKSLRTIYSKKDMPSSYWTLTLHYLVDECGDVDRAPAKIAQDFTILVNEIIKPPKTQTDSKAAAKAKAEKTLAAAKKAAGVADKAAEAAEKKHEAADKNAKDKAAVATASRKLADQDAATAAKNEADAAGKVAVAAREKADAADAASKAAEEALQKLEGGGGAAAKPEGSPK